MSTLIWGMVALLLVLLIGVFATRRTTGGSSVFELGRLFGGGVYQTVFAIIVLPFLIIGLAARNFWVWCTAPPPPPPTPLPVEGHDPIWGREVNKTVAREAFVLIQQARARRDASLARDVLEDLIYFDLQAECDEMIARHEINTRNHVMVTEIQIHKETVDDQLMAGGRHSINWYFSAELRGTMSNVVTREQDGALIAGTAEPQAFEASIGFVRTPEPSDHWRVIYLSGLARSADRREKLRQLLERKDSRPIITGKPRAIDRHGSHRTRRP